jgi:hypothetical protein
MIRKRWLIGFAAIVAVLAFPVGAVAKKGYFVTDASRSMEFHVKGSGGYSISVLGNHGQVYFTAKRGSSSATYVARGMTSPRWIKARFGRLGRVSVRFHPDGPTRLVPLPKGNCRGRGELVQTGAFVGAIEFEGEQAYTTVKATREKGKVTTALKQTCSGDTGEDAQSPGVRSTILSATSKSNNALFAAFKIVSPSHPRFDASLFAASITETLPGPLVILRSISASANVGAFSMTGLGGKVTSATIAPPAPFAGTATYESTKGNRGTWTGSLTGEFLGRGVVGLAGTDFVAELTS